MWGDTMTDSNGENGRDTQGRFVEGNPGGPGNPHVRRTAQCRATDGESAELERLSHRDPVGFWKQVMPGFDIRKVTPEEVLLVIRAWCAVPARARDADLSRLKEATFWFVHIIKREMGKRAESFRAADVVRFEKAANLCERYTERAAELKHYRGVLAYYRLPEVFAADASWRSQEPTGLKEVWAAERPPDYPPIPENEAETIRQGLGLVDVLYGQLKGEAGGRGGGGQNIIEGFAAK